MLVDSSHFSQVSFFDVWLSTYLLTTSKNYFLISKYLCFEALSQVICMYLLETLSPASKKAWHQGLVIGAKPSKIKCQVKSDELTQWWKKMSMCTTQTATHILSSRHTLVLLLNYNGFLLNMFGEIWATDISGYYWVVDIIHNKNSFPINGKRDNSRWNLSFQKRWFQLHLRP